MKVPIKKFVGLARSVVILLSMLLVWSTWQQAPRLTQGPALT
jgi:hypothetical protein